ncbi:MAG: hypothetical protein AAF639_29625 [Chloroflexota bacterium]
MSDEERSFLEELKAKHEKNRRYLLLQLANYPAGEQPLQLHNQIDAEVEAIEGIERQLTVG